MYFEIGFTLAIITILFYIVFLFHKTLGIKILLMLDDNETEENLSKYRNILQCLCTKEEDYEEPTKDFSRFLTVLILVPFILLASISVAYPLIFSLILLWYIYKKYV